MFILSTIEDVVHIQPWDLGKRSRQVIEDNVNQKYANRVIHGVGLCICFFDLLSASDGVIDNAAGQTGVNVSAKFRMLVFRPFRGEIMHAQIAESTENGIRLSMDFFDDILVPPSHLFANTKFVQPSTTSSETRPVYIWHLDLEEPDEETGEMVRKYHFDKTMTVRWRVEDEIWQDQAPAGPAFQSVEQNAVAAARGFERPNEPGADLGIDEREELKAKRAPWRLIGSMAQNRQAEERPE
ncbi:MAG: hypothetical protein Q9159_001808 [Coniocarpon cinnabarinum]